MSGWALGVEIGGTKLQAALGTLDGEIIQTRRGAVSTPRALDILAWFEREIPGLLEHARAQGKTVEGIGVGFGGPIDSASGRVIVSHQVDGWDGVDLRGWFEKTFQLPVAVFNDSNAAGWA